MEVTREAMPIDGERMVNEVIRTHPETVEVFNRFGIDACCGGAAPITGAALRDGADPAELIRSLNEVTGGAA